jgi:uncharacterized protein YcnI
MTMRIIVNKFFMAGFIIGAATLLIIGSASAHVTVKPSETLIGGFQTFTINVPNEKDTPTTSIKLVVPTGLQHVTPTQKAGWSIDTEKTGAGEQAVVTAITWSGGQIADGFRDDFTFSAQVPEKPGELQWKAYQSYSDGTVVSWDKPESNHGHDSENPNEGPFSITRVVSETAEVTTAKKSDQAAADAKVIANRSLYLAAAGVAVGLAGIFLAILKKS